jgi:hypothetical protein
MPTPDATRVRLKWLAVFIVGFSGFIMLAVSAILFHSTSFSDELTKFVGHSVSENTRLAVSLGIGLAAQLVVLISAYLLFPRKRVGT